MNFWIVSVCFEENLGDKAAFSHPILAILLIYESRQLTLSMIFSNFETYFSQGVFYYFVEK